MCKKWCGATRLKHFWKHHIRKALVDDLIAHNESLDDMRSWTEFDPFYSDNLSFKQSTYWMFAKGNIEVGQKNSLRIYDDETRSSALTYYPETQKYVFGNVVYDKNKKRYVYNGYTRVDMFKVKNTIAVEWYYENGEARGAHYLKYRCNNGDMYEGECVMLCRKKDKSYSAIPHGKGKWTFIDGTVMSGKNVAHFGMPNGEGDEGVNYFMGVRIGSDDTKLSVEEYYNKHCINKRKK